MAGSVSTFEYLYSTVSVCPHCLRRIPARMTADAGGIYMEKTCPEHGFMRTCVWADSREGYFSWLSDGGLDPATLPASDEEALARLGGCGFTDPASRPSSTSALMTTNRCNMDCPICFTRDKKDALYEPDLEEVRQMLLRYRREQGDSALLELCGGEPTVRRDILELASLASSLGFEYIQLNTNGLRLASEAELCAALKESGVTTVYLGFDALADAPYVAKYGRGMLDVKLRAVENCEKAGLAVVLVSCVIPGENDGEIGKIVAFAKEHIPTVKGVFFQPVSYFGIYPPEKIRRITIPDVLRALVKEVEDVRLSDFEPGSYEHPQCSFHAFYMQGRDGVLKPLTRRGPKKGTPDVEKLRKTVRAGWMPGPARTLTIGGMAFQDAWNIDLLRTMRCSLQIIGKDGHMYPLCCKYLSSTGGSRILPEIS